MGPFFDRQCGMSPPVKGGASFSVGFQSGPRRALPGPLPSVVANAERGRRSVPLPQTDGTRSAPGGCPSRLSFGMSFRGAKSRTYAQKCPEPASRGTGSPRSSDVGATVRGDPWGPVCSVVERAAPGCGGSARRVTDPARSRATACPRSRGAALLLHDVRSPRDLPCGSPRPGDDQASEEPPGVKNARPWLRRVVDGAPSLPGTASLPGTPPTERQGRR